VSDLDAELTDIFRDEAAERLDQMEASLLAVESGDAGAESVDSLFRNAHTIKGAAGMLGLDDIRVLAHAVEDVLAGVRGTGAFPPELAAPLLRATTVLRAQVAGAQESVEDLLRDLAASTAMLGPGGAGLADADAGARRAGAGEASPPAADVRKADPEADRSKAERRPLRVPAEKIDRLLDVVGEVMQYRGRLAHSLGGQAQLSPDVADVLSSGDRMLDELKDTAIGMRTLPVAVITRRLPLAVRDLCTAAGKDVELVVTGADTELDRVILESLYEPLAHLLRNAVIHGIESPAERLRARKPARGRLEVRSVPRGSLVEIVVADDGRGVSAEVAEEARHEGSLADVLARPGYSTAAEVTDLAGRGVGLDAVRSYVHSMGGTFEVRSEPGLGMEVALLLPLALALLDVLLFQRGETVYGVPLAVAEEVVMVTRTLVLEGRAVLDVRGRLLPVADVADLVGARAPCLDDRPHALVIAAGGRRAVVMCDAVLGAEELVIKPLSPLFGGLDGYLGTAILGDGRIALLADPAMLTRGSRRPTRITGPAEDGPVVPKILVVEDSFTVRELQRSILEAAGYAVVTARHGRDALAALDRDTEIALVVTDLEMPELGGLELTRAIRADGARSSLPVVIVTSRGSEDDMRRGVEAGADAYMAKQGFDQHALLATVERLVGR
jgi:two-component system, chemotaxis family, sensor kinase CheA